jgi:hypothetical protein
VSGQNLLQVRMQRNLQNHAGLLLAYVNEPVPNMLTAHADDVAPPLGGIKQ